MHDELSADELVARYILDHYRDAHRTANPERHTTRAHLANCPDTTVADPDATDGSYGCDTGCSYVRFTATIACPHGHSDDYDYGEFGELSYILEDIERDYDAVRLTPVTDKGSEN